MAKINLLAGNRLNVQFGSTPDDAVVVSNEVAVGRKVIVGGKIVIDENYGKQTIGGSIFVPEEEVARLGNTKLINVGGQMYQAASTERLVNIGGTIYYEYAQATGVEDAGSAITVDAGSIVLSGLAPTVETAGGVNHSIEVPTGELTITGEAPTTAVSISVAPDEGSLVITGEIPDVTRTDNHARAPPAGALVLTGLSPVILLGGSFTITDVDGDESIFEGQTGVVVTMSGSIAVSGKRVFIEQGGNHVEQTVTAEDGTTATITVTYGGVLTPGTATLYVWDPI